MSLVHKKSPYTPIPFSLWILDNGEDLKREFLSLYGPHAAEFTKCTECGGDGYQVCDLGYEHDCEECDGSGDEEDPIERYMADEYQAQVGRDQKVFVRYTKELSHAG